MVIGFVLSFSTIGYASDVIETVLYSVKIYINGQEKDLSEDYQVLNYKGHAYVPVRFITEELKGKVTYDDAEKSINVALTSIEPVPLKGYVAENALQNGDVVLQNGNWVNTESIEKFLQNVSSRQQDWIRMTRFTEEGDAILFELLYDGTSFWFMADNSRDVYGGIGGRDRTIERCTSFEKDDSGTYWIKGCANKPPMSFPGLVYEEPN